VHSSRHAQDDQQQLQATATRQRSNLNWGLKGGWTTRREAEINSSQPILALSSSAGACSSLNLYQSLGALIDAVTLWQDVLSQQQPLQRGSQLPPITTSPVAPGWYESICCSASRSSDAPALQPRQACTQGHHPIPTSPTGQCACRRPMCTLLHAMMGEPTTTITATARLALLRNLLLAS
jgi:hypothetical protein